MAVLDLTVCPICKARDSLTRQTRQLESRTHVTYVCQKCGTLLAWLGDEMWLEADRWSFQKVGLPGRSDLLYRSMTVAELHKLSGEKPPHTALTGKDTVRKPPPPTWVEMMPAPGKRIEEALPGELDDEPRPGELGDEAQPPAREPKAEAGVVAAVFGAAALAQDNGQLAEAQPLAEEVPPPGPAAETAMAGSAAFSQEAEQAAEQPVAPQEPLAEVPVEEGAADLSREAPPATAEAEAPGPGDVPSSAPIPTQSRQPRRRGRGSPFLVISVGLVLLCLICSAAAMVIYSIWEKLPALTEPTAILPAGEVQPAETVLPAEVPTHTSTEEAPPEAADEILFQGVTDYLSSTGSHYLVGEVVNKTGDTLRFVEVLATFFDAAGQVVGTGSTFTELSIIEPGSTAPFKMTMMDPSGVGHYDLRVDYSTTTQSPIRPEISSHRGSATDSGWYQVTGEVRNPYGFTIGFPEIVATYYNATHEVVRVEVDFAHVDPLEPGQSSTFEVNLTDPPADLQHYVLQTEGIQR